MATDHVTVSLPQPLAEHVESVVGAKGYYETSAEYVRSLIRRDMEETDVYQAREAIREGYLDMDARRFFPSSGDFSNDREIFKSKEAGGWK